jgi:hypothetical protein
VTSSTVQSSLIPLMNQCYIQNIHLLITTFIILCLLLLIFILFICGKRPCQSRRIYQCYQPSRLNVIDDHQFKMMASSQPKQQQQQQQVYRNLSIDTDGDDNHENSLGMVSELESIKFIYLLNHF